MRQKLTFYLTLIFLVIGTGIRAQVVQSFYSTNKWRFSDPKQFGFTVLDLHFLDNNLGYAVGANGGIARTTDGGAKWQYGPFTFMSPAGMITTGSFTDVHAASSTTAYAVGSNGMMAKTTDAGQNWSFVRSPLYIQSKNINACWFLNKDTGYIGGGFNTPDSLAKLYFTKDGGNTWDSIASPQIKGKSRVGFVANPTYPPMDINILDAKAKEIYRIIFVNANLGYVSGQASPLFPSIGIPNITNATTCVTSGIQTSTAHNAPLLWKFSNGTLTDYSITKERLGYTGITTIPSLINCTSKYGFIAPISQTYRAMNVYDDSTVVLMSLNNNCVIKVRTGRNDSTVNINTGLKEAGKYELLNYAGLTVFNPSINALSTVYAPIPLTQVLLASQPYQIKKSSSGKLFAAAGFGAMWTSIDTGRNWIRENSLPQGRNYSSFSTTSVDILPNGRVITAGAAGVVADSTAGAYNSSYVLIGSGGSKVDFADCNNGIVTGGGSIAVTTDGGKNWVAKNRADFIASFYNIAGFSYANINRAYFAVSNGIIYGSTDQATTLDPVFSDFSMQMNDVVGIGNDTIYAVGYSQFSILPANRKSSFFRSVNNGTTWQTVDIATTTATPAFTAPAISKMAFPSRQVGYVIGNRNAVYKTTDGGLTWTSISPFPALNYAPSGFPNAMISYTGICAVDDNTVFVTGNMFTNTGVRRAYKTTDGGATWVDITGNIPALASGNLSGILFSDVNNGYIISGNALYVTNNSGTTWTLEVAPHGNGHTTLGFAPRTVPASMPFANRKLFMGVVTAGPNIPTIMEFGDTSNVNVNATTVVTNATCTNITGGAVTVTATGGLAPYSYSINGTTFQASNTFTGLTQGAKTITIKDALCGITTRPVTIGFTDNLTLTAAPADTSVCAGAPVPLRTTSAATTYLWTPSAGLSNPAIANPVATTNSNKTYTVTATLNGCVKTGVVNINIKANPVISAGPDKTIVAGADVRLEGSAGSNIVSIAWTPETTITAPNTLTPLAKPSVTTPYRLTIRNSDGCVSTDDATVTVIPYCVKIMNAFTPNGDAINDRWKVTTGDACTNQVMVKVFNRYGTEVYSNDNYKNDWDGNYKGKPVADGTYYYAINFRLISGKVVPVKGDVTILR